MASGWGQGNAFGNFSPPRIASQCDPPREGEGWGCIGADESSDRFADCLRSCAEPRIAAFPSLPLAGRVDPRSGAGWGAAAKKGSRES